MWHAGSKFSGLPICAQCNDTGYLAPFWPCPLSSPGILPEFLVYYTVRLAALAPARLPSVDLVYDRAISSYRLDESKVE